MKPRSLASPRLSPLWPALALALAACGPKGSQGPVDGRAADAPVVADGAAPADAGPPPGLADVTTRAAKSICGALFRCCDTDLATYFGAYAANEQLAAFRDRLPPMAALDEPGCEGLVKEMLDVVPLGDWVAAATRGDVQYDAPAFGACLATLDQAACGAPVRDALFDPTCLGFAPPAGGAEQRAAFHRVKAPGASCTPIRDGVGAQYYGTCDPNQGYCCYPVPGRNGCQPPFDVSGNARTGTCNPVAPLGQACNLGPPITLCATGQDCTSDSATGPTTCVAPATGPLANGAACIDAGYNTLGVCTDGFCDVLGTGKCTARKANGVACGGGDECASGLCQARACAANTVCDGPNPPPPAVDAGVDAPAATVDAGAGPDAAALSGEACGTARDLVTSSATSPVSGYTKRVMGAFGATNDYNPLKDANLPPRCSLVYDARGKEVVYAVTLAPGDRLKAQATLADGKRAALYLLDACPAATWPDFDGTTLCGSNEYFVATCGAVGCDPVSFNVLYPTAVGGSPTVAKTFWLVIDQVDGDASTGYTVDWTILH